MNSMGEMIAARRKELGMTQKELAQQMNVTDKAVSKWERNIACPDINSISHLAEVLGITVAELMDAQPVEKPEENGIKEIVELVLRVVPVAMGVAVATLSLMKQLDLQSGFSMLGIGMFCLGLLQLPFKKQ